MLSRAKKEEIDELTGLPILPGLYGEIQKELDARGEIGFVYFEIVQFRHLEEKYGFPRCRDLLKLIGKTLRAQTGSLYRDEDLVVVGGKGLDYFMLFLFSPPRKKDHYANHDLKIITARIKQKLQNVVNEHSDELTFEEEIDFNTGYTVIHKDPHMKVERLVYEARKEAGFKAQLEEIMVQFISNVTHELRTPLTSIKGYAETLIGGALNDKDLSKRWLEIIYDEAQRLERLINDLLDLSLLEAEQVELHFKKTNLKDVVEQVISILHPVASKEGVTIKASFDDDFPVVVVDEDRIKQVLLNLIHNAVKYSPRGEEVLVKGEKMRGKVKISVIDKGCGIPRNHLNRIFERFYRVDTRSTAKAAGRGLGLAIARHIVESHGGNIGVQSPRRKGSAFYFTIPLDIDLNLIIDLGEK